jgi:hypothetical protein
VVPAAVEVVLCRGDPSAGVSMGCLPQHPWGLFLMASTPLPRTNTGHNKNQQQIYKFLLVNIYRFRRRQFHEYLKFKVWLFLTYYN